MIGRLLTCLLLACAALAAGCGGDQNAKVAPPSTVPAAPPTTRQLAQIRSTSTTPFFWLGRAHGAQRLTRATLTAADPPDSIFQYGRPTCRAGVGCSYELGVATLRKRNPDTTQRCWQRLGPALTLGCDQATALQVYTGPVEVFLTSRARKPSRVVRALRLKGPTSTAGRPLSGLAAPQPFTCAEAKILPADFRAHLPMQLAPGACGGARLSRRTP
jgi:hypothetical protein